MQKNESLIYRSLRPGFCFFFCLFRNPVIEGIENIPQSGSVVLAGNHTSPNDIFILISSTKRVIHFLGKDELFKGPMKKFFTSAGVIPVNRRTKDGHALRAAEEVLQNGRVIGIFPEGTTKKNAPVTILPFKIGAVKMAHDTGAPIVPFAITGKYGFFRKTVKLKFYPPFLVESDDLTSENEKFMERITQYILNEEN